MPSMRVYSQQISTTCLHCQNPRLPLLVTAGSQAPAKLLTYKFDCYFSSVHSTDIIRSSGIQNSSYVNDVLQCRQQ